MCGVSTLLEKEGRGVEETSGCLWFVLILTKTFPAGYLEQVNSGGWNFCATHWQRWVWYHRNTIQNWGRDLLSTSAHRGFFFLSILCILVKGLCVFLQLCVWWRGMRMVVALCFVFQGVCCFCFGLISEVELLLTYFDTRPQMCIRWGRKWRVPVFLKPIFGRT